VQEPTKQLDETRNIKNVLSQLAPKKKTYSILDQIKKVFGW
jgi:hypothetical protein